MSNQFVFDSINSQRIAKNYLTIEETIALTQRGNIILDPFSTLISRSVVIGENNKIYPNVVIEITGDGSIEIKSQNLFSPQTFILADKGGKVFIGSFNHFEGGVAIKANMSGSQITFGDNGRYLNGVQIIGKSHLGNGSQIIGNITAQNCVLAEGESYLHENPNMRGGLLKGFGLARGLTIGKGRVIDGRGIFEITEIQDQSYFHKKKGKANEIN